MRLFKGNMSRYICFFGNLELGYKFELVFGEYSGFGLSNLNIDKILSCGES